MRALAKGTLLVALVMACCRPALAAKGPPILGAKPAHCAVKRSHYYVGPEWPGKGYGWAAKKALKWQGYGPLGTGAYRGFGYGLNGYPTGPISSAIRKMCLAPATSATATFITRILAKDIPAGSIGRAEQAVRGNAAILLY